MSRTLTTRIGFSKPDPGSGEPYDASVDLGSNWDKAEGMAGTTICTAATRPTGADRWDGRVIYETDTRRRYQWSSNLTLWLPLLSGRSASGPYLLGLSTDTTGEGLNMEGSVAGADMIRVGVAGDAQRRWVLEADGGMLWGGGALVGDTNLYRASANKLKTDDAFEAAGAMTALAGLAVTGNLTVTGIGGNVPVSVTGSHFVVNNQATPQDTPLTCAVLTGQNWAFRMWAEITSGTTPDIKVDLGVPGTSTWRMSVTTWNRTAAAGAQAGDQRTAINGETVAIPGQGTTFNTQSQWLDIMGRVTTDAGGNIRLRLGQNTANASDTTLYIGSWAIFTRTG